MIENHKKHSLGRRAYLLFLAKRIKAPIVLFACTAFALYAERWIPFYQNWVSFGVECLLVVAVAYFLLVVLQTYLEYRLRTYTFTEDAFYMTHGYAVRNEVAAVYHQIQGVNIRRGMLDRTIGVSQIIILMAGTEANRIQFVLPGVGKTKAKLVQQELLARARKHVVPGYATTPEVPGKSGGTVIGSLD